VARLSTMALWPNGCAFGTRWPELAPRSVALADNTVVPVRTRVVLDVAQRAEFDRQNSRVLASMGQQPGLLGDAAGRQIFGNAGWTMSVGASEDARAAFVKSAVHREAIARRRPALLAVELKRLTVARKDLPSSGDAALRLLADPVGLRSDWE